MEVTPNAVDAAVSRLRRRLAGARANIEIHTAHGLGYVLTPPVDAPRKPGT
jgi:DNA-binding response OmpR family regulator